ncbi:MAG: RagB/SusD family nutrient uptake outer membrane protein [Paludibacter sp.]|nr:RagB/SusD family nutrient uptake outer membrane protein [Paludibacter sp.]
MRKKKYNQINSIFVAATIILASLLTACDDLLDTTSPSSVSSATIFNTPERIKGLVNGTYKSLKSSNLYNGQILFYNDIRAEEFVCRTENALAGGYVWANNINNLTGAVSSVWEQFYAVINSTNVLIDGLNKSTGIISDDQKKNYLGEAHFLRALAYFHLVTTYGRPYVEDNGAGKAVPLRLQPEISSANNDLERSTVASIYNQIIDDLDFAEENLPEAYTSNLLNTTRAHKNTAIALKTRVFLNKGAFDKVIEEASKIVPQDQAPFSATSGVKHALQSDITSVFSTNYTTSESIFSIPMTSSDPPAGTALAITYFSSPAFVLNSNANGIISDAGWRSTDKRRNFVQYSSDLNLYLLAKYKKTSPAVDYIPVIRYAEVLLNYAEAEARDGSLTKAIDLLKAVRNRSDESYTFPANVLTAGEILNTIRVERRIELLGEGFRTNDILRDLLTFPVKPTLSSLTAREVKPADDGYIFPIPNTEILTNKLIDK